MKHLYLTLDTQRNDCMDMTYKNNTYKRMQPIQYIFLLFVLLLQNAHAQDLAIGDTVPDFKLWLTDDTRMTQEDIKGKVTVFKFWFTKCMPCIVDIKGLNDIVATYKGREDIVFVAPALDRSDRVKNFLNYNPFHFKIAYSAYNVSEVFNPKQIYPSYYIVDKNGVLVYIDNDTKRTDTSALKKAIEEVMNN